ncbi:hypothetical protein UA08_02541 [Talaromyces atroroseus]|uniref:Zn(2)-C6 fungal-type domain-containing protein n=1 Tax=Talaromyces atroroseus TaxID=1441469 RepID=A0A225B554_TALAT|nr:hypothetical protein UA08_02541 [Talaromyces atroroseus]OKL61995.1 hypothetical protein UA08_02541 [Talaromyces atroroseus]
MAESSKRSAPSADTCEPRKRGKYTQVACNECKRRKLKCSGGDVCKRCASNGMTCVYALQSLPTQTRTARPPAADQSSWRFKTLETRMLAMQKQLDLMSAEIGVLQKRSLQPLYQPIKTSSSSSNPADARWTNRAPVSPSYIGPTSSEFGLNVPDDAPELDETQASDNVQISVSNSPSAVPPEEEQGNISISSTNPLLSLAETDVLRLVDIYEEAAGLMYPVVDLESIREYIVDFYRQHLDGSADHLCAPQNGNEAWWFSARDSEVLKIVLALALISESNGKSELGNVLAANVENNFASTRTQVPEVDMKELIILTLVALYHSFRDDDVLAWRTIGLAARGAVQMGLHRYDTWLRTGGIFPGDLERSWAINLFWCIYVFDKEFSFETGLPFAMRDSEMDATLPEPTHNHTYLRCMISYCRVGGKIWDLMVGWGSTAIEVSSITEAHLNHQIHEWEESIPPELRLKVHSEDSVISARDARLVTPQILLHLRANQMRILVYKQNLLSTDAIKRNLKGAEIAVANAKNTIQALELGDVSKIFSHRPQPFNRFLFSALATLFLAMFHFPEGFRNVCLDNFYDALDALKRSSTRGKHSRRLQKVMKNLKRINTNNPTNRQEEFVQARARSSRSIAVEKDPEMTPTAQLMDVNTSLYAIPPTLVNGNTPVDDYSDLTNFFEFAGDCFMDDHTDQMNNISTEAPTQQYQNFVDMFQAENETLTRLMAGLL